MTATIPTAEGLSITDTLATEEYTVGCLSILNRTGDVRAMWDSRNKAEVEAARKQFEDLVGVVPEAGGRPAGGKGYLAYKAKGKDGSRGEQITKFDKKAERIILVSPPVGG